MRTNNRWVIAIAGVFLQIALGAVYAWSVFRIPLAKQFGWSISEVTLTFTISTFVLGSAAFFGGLWLNRVMAASMILPIVISPPKLLGAEPSALPGSVSLIPRH